MTHLQPGALLQGGKYRIEKFLGQGGFGITYLGWHVSLNSRVAVKEFFMKDYCDRAQGTYQVTMGTSGSMELVLRFREKFIKEARHIYALSHPHIVRVIDVFEENGTAYYVMEYLGGGTLQDAVQAHGALSVSVASDYVRQVASALDYIHGRNLLHLDVKPSNIMLNDSGDAVLVDFGVSKRYDESGHQTSSTPLGVSEGYAPIEQYESGGMAQFFPSTDIYSLGATYYYLLTGIRPPKASALLSESLSFPVSIPEDIQTCIVSAMSPVRKDRPQSIGEFLHLLGTAVGRNSHKTAKNECTVLDATIVESEVLRQGLTPESGKVSVSGRILSKKWLVPVMICLFIGLCAYFFEGGSFNNSEYLFGRGKTEPYDRFKQAMALEGQQRVNALLDLAKDGVGYTYFPLAYYYFSEGNISEADKWLAQSLHTVDNEKAKKLIEEKINEGCINLDLTYAALKFDAHRREDSLLFAKWANLRGDIVESKEMYKKLDLSNYIKPQTIDLGLPSGTLWGSCNLNAEHYNTDGQHFAFGEIVSKDNYPKNIGDNYKEGESIIGTSNDAATVILGKNWQLPSISQVKELIKYCSFRFNSDGLMVVGPNGNTMFLPYTRGNDNIGYYWTGNKGYVMEFQVNPPPFISENFASYCGLSIRPVYRYKKSSVSKSV